ncbi:MAG TPA: glycosyltransferase [Tenuifilaceae bacterium]|nr:glycosyltransferase [Tenuifilaceae bacterium]HPW50439.1 glycosyltransferase [Tenuifilaceae bacterium]
MISFIVIGKNEGWKLTTCFEGVFRAIEHNNIKDYEVIYVDSQSTDDSIQRAKSFSQVKIFQLGNVCNAAIARNVGVEESSGEVLFFIDGDMEITSDFLPLVYDEKSGLKYPFVSGQLKNYNYDSQNQFLSNTWQYREVLNGDKRYATTGGIFLIQRELWVGVGGMDNRFKRGQDLELGLRLAKKGFKILRKQEIIAKHYTIAYTHPSRIWKIIFSGDIAYANSFLLKKHFLNIYIYSRLFRSYYTLFSFFFFLTISIVLNNFYYLLGYLFFIGIKTYKNKVLDLLRLFELFIYFIVCDFSFLFYLVIPHNSIDKSKITYSIIQ